MVLGGSRLLYICERHGAALVHERPPCGQGACYTRVLWTSRHVTPVANCSVTYWASIRHRWSDRKVRTTQTVLSYMASSVADPGDALPLSGVSSIRPVSGIRWHVQGTPNSFATTVSNDFSMRWMWHEHRMVWEGLGALLAVPRCIVHKLNNRGCNEGHFHKILDVCSARILFNTTTRNHGSTVRKLLERIEILPLNSPEIGTKFTSTAT